MAVKKQVWKVLIFILLVAVCFLVCQNVIAYDWNRNELLKSRYKDYAAEEDGAVDALFFGPSTTYADVLPVVIYEESGITSYNMGTSNQIPYLSYYELLYLLKLHEPKVVVLDFSAIALDKDVDADQRRETIYRKMTDTMPDPEIKKAMIDDITTRFTSQRKLDYYLTLLRYHDRWEELTSYDFDSRKVDAAYEKWMKGGTLNNHHAAYEMPENFFNAETNEAVPLYLEYYQKMVDLCKERGIDVLVFLAPKLALRPGDYMAARDFAKANDLKILSFASEKTFSAGRFDPAEDFYDTSHLNLKGQRKVSRLLAKALATYYELPGHRGEEGFQKWDEYSRIYEERYAEMTASMIESDGASDDAGAEDE
ncbi:MAG: hypothetical protein IJM69_07620 [Firmicutes bacterium]|nr:hypothetical protein [Bacillota bacterium]